MRHSEKCDNFAAAYVLAQSQIHGAVKDSVNPFFKSSYADLASIMDACKKPLNDNGIGILQPSAPSKPNTIAIETILLHKSGEWMSSKTTFPLSKIDPQSVGSVMTYARRYALAAMVGVCPVDDDAESAVDRGKPPARQASKPADPVMSGDDAEQAFTDIVHAFQDRQFTADVTDSIIKKTLTKFKFKDIASAGRPFVDKLIANINSGIYDSFKKEVA